MRYPAIQPARKSGEEPITTENGIQIGDLVSFWRWAYSDLIGNTERGALAEYLVACALSVQDSVRINWDKYDLLSPEGIAVEVKSSAYLQSWGQEKLSAISFGIQPTHGWNEADNAYANEIKRQADIYVFCVHKHQEQKSLNPLDLAQWDFYLLPTTVLNERAKGQKTIVLKSLLSIGAEKCSFQHLHERIVQLVQNK